MSYMQKKTLIVTLTLALLFISIVNLGGASAESSDWAITVTASNGVLPITFGVHHAATAYFDVNYDAVAPPMPPTGSYSYLYLYDSTANSTFQALSTSILSSSGDSQGWVLKIHNLGDAGDITLDWSTSGNIPAKQLTLTGASETISMKNQSSYTFHANAYNISEPSSSLYSFAIYAELEEAAPTVSPGGPSGPNPTPTFDPTTEPTTNPTDSTSPRPSPYDLPELTGELKILIFVAIVAIIVIAIVAVLRRPTYTRPPSSYYQN